MIQTKEDLKAYANEFTYVDPELNEGKSGICLAIEFQAQFLFFGGHLPNKMLALLECIEAYNTLYGDKLTWGFEPRRWKQRKIKSMPTIQKYAQEMIQEGDIIQWYVASGDDDNEAPEFVIECLTNRDWKMQNASCVQFRVGRNHVFDLEKSKKLEELIFLFINKLQPYHAYAGFQIATPYEEADVEPDMVNLAYDFKGVCQHVNSWERLQIKNGLKTIDWFNFISNTLTERVGGASIFPQYCKYFDVVATPYANGFIIKTGEVPQIIPTKEPVPQSYLDINRALRPLRNGKYGGMATGSINGEVRFDDDLSDLWIRRYDEPTMWSPDLGEHDERKPLKKTHVKSGEKCVVYGRYRYHDQKQLDGKPEYVSNDDRDSFVLDAKDDRQFVILMVGDIAPYFLELGQHGEFLGRKTIKWELVSELILDVPTI